VARRGRRNPDRNPSLADEVLDFGRFLRVPEGDLVGQPWKWLPWQEAWIRATFGGNRRVRRSILSVARRNGKTTLAAVLVLAAIYGPLAWRNARLISASRTAKQARIVFEYAAKMARMSGHSPLVHIRDTAAQIEGRRTGASYQAVSAEAKNAFGFGAQIVIHDELGQVVGPRDALYDALSTALGSYRHPLELIISTQAPSDGDLLSILIDDALEGEDPTSIATVYSAPLDADPWIEATWLCANPSAGHNRSLSDLARMAARARRVPGLEPGFRNLLLNQRVALEAPWLARSVWEACDREPDEDVLRRGPCYGGLDLSARQDLTSLVLVAEDEASQIHARCWAWTPADTLAERAARDRAPYELWCSDGFLRALPGTSIPYSKLALELGEIAAAHQIEAVNFDRWRISELQYELDQAGIWLPLVPCGQGFKDMTPALEAIEHAALARDLRHGGNPVLRAAVANARVSIDPAGNRKLDKRRATGRIDPAVALAMAGKALRYDRQAGGLLQSSGMVFL